MTDWKEKRVIVLGAARQGIALGRFLASHGASVLMNDHKPADQLEAARISLSELDPEAAERVDWFFGSHPISLLQGIEMVCISGGVPLDLPIIQEARRRGIPLTNDSQIFLEACPCMTIGITGSAGKTTTTTLVGRIAQTALVADMPAERRYHNVWVGGNIGSPLISVLDEMQPDDLAVMELSSFQLEIMNESVDIACVLNITPNHLDRHACMEAYIAVKRRILENQSNETSAVIGFDDPGSWSLAPLVKGSCYSFGKKRVPGVTGGAFIHGKWIALWDGMDVSNVMRQAEIKLRGWHNIENVLAACAISHVAGLPVLAMRNAIESFTGVVHRLEWVHTWGGADWYNDSIATAPERVIAAIQSFSMPEDINRPIVLLLGGRDKNLPWNQLAELVHQRVDHLILFGEAAQKIAQAVGASQPGGRPYSVDKCQGLEPAVKLAARLVEPGDIVLLSPGGTSFDEFRDFEERGEAYKRWVFNLSCM